MTDENGTTEPQYPGLNDAVAQAIREALAAGALAAPLEAPPTAGLQMAITPKLGLKQPALDDPALITDINDNMTILDNSITASGVATLTNKTLTSPIITNPTITGWANAQHSHLDAAGAGQLDGGAIVSGDIGTGFVVRESYVQDYMNAGPDLVDAVVRNVLWWGAVGGSETPTTAITMPAAGTLRTDATVGVRVNPLVWGTVWPAIQLGQGGSVGGSTNVGAAGGGLYLRDNAYVTTAQLNAGIDPLRGTVSIALSQGGIQITTSPAPASAGATVTPVNRIVMATTGTLFVSPDPGQMAINATESVRVQGNNVNIGPAGNNPGSGGRVIYNDDSGALHWSSGMLAVPSARSFVIYDFVRGAQVFTIDSATGALTVAISSSSGAAFTGNGNFISTQPEGQPEAVRLGSAYTSPGVYGSARFCALAEAVLQLRSLGSNIHLSAGTGVMHPISDNTLQMGHASYRFTVMYAVAGAINTSVYEAKEAFAPLDPKACAAAVLETDWMDYRYRPPVYQEPDVLPGEGKTTKERQQMAAATKAGYLKMVAETTDTRHQKGYVLQSPEHKVHDLFGLDDRQSASPGSDLAVVACALQGVLQRLAALETGQPLTPDAPTTTRTRRKAS